MDKETQSNYGWIVICVLVLAVMIALATPFGDYISTAVKSTTQGLFDVNQNALDAAGITIEDQTFWQAQNGAKIYYDRIYYTAEYNAVGIWHRDGSMELYQMSCHYKIPAKDVRTDGLEVIFVDPVCKEMERVFTGSEDGNSVEVTVYVYTDIYEENGIQYANSASLIDTTIATITEYTSIEEWYNATHNS